MLPYHRLDIFLIRRGCYSFNLWCTLVVEALNKIIRYDSSLKVLFYIRCTKCVEEFSDKNYLKSMCFYDIYYVGGMLWRN